MTTTKQTLYGPAQDILVLTCITLRVARALRIRAGFPEPLHLAYIKYECTVYSEMFARILFSRIALKHIFATFIIRDKGVIYLYQQTTE